MTEEINTEKVKEPETDIEVYDQLTYELQTILSHIPEAISKYKDVIGEENIGEFYLDLLGGAVASSVYTVFPEDNMDTAIQVIQNRIEAVSNALRGKESKETVKIITPDQKIIGS